jgi:hypothetical protein
MLQSRLMRLDDRLGLQCTREHLFRCSDGQAKHRCRVRFEPELGHALEQLRRRTSLLIGSTEAARTRAPLAHDLCATPAIASLPNQKLPADSC